MSGGVLGDPITGFGGCAGLDECWGEGRHEGGTSAVTPPTRSPPHELLPPRARRHHPPLGRSHPSPTRGPPCPSRVRTAPGRPGQQAWPICLDGRDLGRPGVPRGGGEGGHSSVLEGEAGVQGAPVTG